MCVIACYEKNRPKLKDLQAMEDINQHGAGIAWIEDDQVRYEKGLTHKEIWHFINKVKIPLPFTVHFRIKSVGSIVSELTHPFEITNNVPDKLSGKCDAVLFHNGTYLNWDDDLLDTCIKQGLKIPDGHLSDSKALAFLCSVYGNNYLKLIKTTSRFTIMTKDGIQRYGDWKEGSNGICSNDNHFDKATNSTWRPNSRWFQGAYRTDKEIKEIEAEDEKKRESRKVDPDKSLLLDQSEYKVECQDGSFNVWSNKGVLLRRENKFGYPIKFMPQKIDPKQLEIDYDQRLDNLDIPNMNDDDQKELYENTCKKLIKMESKILALDMNITSLNRIDNKMKETKRKSKLQSTQRRLDKAEDDKEFYMAILEEIVQNSTSIHTIPEEFNNNDHIYTGDMPLDYVDYI